MFPSLGQREAPCTVNTVKQKSDSCLYSQGVSVLCGVMTKKVRRSELVHESTPNRGGRRVACPDVGQMFSNQREGGFKV